MAYNQKETAGRGNMPKTGRGIPLSMKSPMYKTEDPKIKTEQLEEVSLGTVKPDDKGVKNPFTGQERNAAGARIPKKYVTPRTLTRGQVADLKKKYTL